MLVNKNLLFRVTVLAIFVFPFLFLQCQKTTGPGNSAPVIFSMTPSKQKLNFRESITIITNVQDADGDTLNFLWLSDRGIFGFTSLDSALWTAPDSPGSVLILLQVSDIFNGTDAERVSVFVQNQPPVITSVAASDTIVLVGNNITLSAEAEDPDGGTLTFKWEADGGEFIGSITDETAVWRASTSVSNVTISFTATDENDESTTATIIIKVFQELGSLWISDTFNNQLVKLGSNGTELFRLNGLSRPQGMAFDITDRSLWVADRGGQRVVKYSDTGSLVFEVTGFDRPTDIALQANGNVWVTSMADTGQVVEISHNGNVLRTLSGFSNPQSIDVNRLNGDIWITDTGNDRIILLNPQVPDGYNLDSIAVAPVRFDVQFSNYSNPEAIDVDQTTGICWVADTGNHRVVRINKIDLTEFIVSGFLNPRGIAVNNLDGSCWVANTGDNEVIKLFHDIITLPNRQPFSYNIDDDAGFHFVISGYIQPWAIDINVSENIVWFADNFKLVKIHDRGNSFALLNEVLNFNAPKSLTINSGSLFKGSNK
ncbi:NHL repeat-containing protein [candidate division KSB1 bacterium]|nr:NHL repeat-containing protein [candidate division KSB1 bacterium]